MTAPTPSPSESGPAPEPSSSPSPSSSPDAAADAAEAAGAGPIAIAVARLERLLRDPQTYRAVAADADAEPALRADAPSIVHTHGAILGFGGDRVLKIKKPVDLGFFDFRDPEYRREVCTAEVRLNRRLAPEVYLGVASVIATGDGLTVGPICEPDDAVATGCELDAGGTRGTVIDHAVVMTRLPAADMLDRRLADGRITDADLDRIAERLAGFHAAARRGPDVAAFADPEALRTEFRTNLEQLGALDPSATALSPGRPVALPVAPSAAPPASPPAAPASAASPATPTTDGPHPLDAAHRTAIGRWLDAHVRDAAPLLCARRDAGRVCEGHGDLHSGNICLVGPGPDGVIAFDCIEFEPAFRCGDVARELGVLAMDLAARGARDAADHLLGAYAARTDDRELPGLARLFAVHFALVRAKIATLHARDASHDPAADAAPNAASGAAASAPDPAAAARHDITRYGLAALARTVEPALVLTCGLPGTGKSTLAHAVAGPLGAIVVRSDVERKRLAGIEPTQTVSADRQEQLYAPEMTRRTYDRVTERAADALARGRHVVLDATYSRAAERARAIELARRLDRPWVVLYADRPRDVAHRWIAARADDPTNVSDADRTVHDRARASFEPPTELPAARVVHVRDLDPDPHALALAVLDAAANAPS